MIRQTVFLHFADGSLAQRDDVPSDAQRINVAVLSASVGYVSTMLVVTFDRRDDGQFYEVVGGEPHAVSLGVE